MIAKTSAIALALVYWDKASVLVSIGLLDPDNLPVLGRQKHEK